MLTHYRSYSPLGTDFDEREIKSILLTTSRDPSRAALFNHASMAHNTHFFFRGLAKSSQPSSSSSTEPNNGTDATPSAFSKNDNVPPPALLRALESSFSSLDTLRRELAATAMGMFGPGFVWVVRLGSGGDGGPGLYGSLGASGGGGGVPEFRILATYLAGTPYPQAHWRRQGGDMNTLPAGSGGDGGPFGASQQGYLGPWAGTAWTSTGRPLGAATGGAGSVSPPMAAPGMAAGGGLHQPGMWRRAAPGGVADLTPVLCLCTWEHVWLHDYGVGGKREFVENWWKTVDWEGVANMAGIRARREDVL